MGPYPPGWGESVHDLGPLGAAHAEIRRLQAIIEAIRRLHYPLIISSNKISYEECIECHRRWPCKTTEMLEINL